MNAMRSIQKLPLALIFVLTTACPDDEPEKTDAGTPAADAVVTDNGGNADATPDAGREDADPADAPGQDATDAEPADLGVDGGMPTNEVTVRVVNGDGTLVENVPVFFHDPTGAVIASTVTGANG